MRDKLNSRERFFGEAIIIIIFELIYNFSFALFCNLYYRALSGTKVSGKKTAASTIIFALILSAATIYLHVTGSINYLMEAGWRSILLAFLCDTIVSFGIFWIIIRIIDKKTPKFSSAALSYIINIVILVASVFIFGMIFGMIAVYFGAEPDLDLFVNIGIIMSVPISTVVYLIIKRKNGK